MRRHIIKSWHRFYDPKIGRYLNADPIGLLGGINMFAYLGGNPVNLIDPWGLAPGDLFNTMDEAAIDAIDYSMPHSMYEGVEYGGFLYKILFGKSKGKYSYAKPVPGKRREIEVKTFNCIPKKTIKVGIYHTHLHDDNNDDFYTNRFSDEDNWVADMLKINIYLGTKKGLIMKRKYEIGNQKVTDLRDWSAEKWIEFMDERTKIANEHFYNK